MNYLNRLLIPEYEWSFILYHISCSPPSMSSISSCSSILLLNVPSGEYQAVVSPHLLLLCPLLLLLPPLMRMDSHVPVAADWEDRRGWWKGWQIVWACVCVCVNECVCGGLLAVGAMLGLPSAAATKHSAAFPSAPLLLLRTSESTDWLNSCPQYVCVTATVHVCVFEYACVFYSEALPVACERLHLRVKWCKCVYVSVYMWVSCCQVNDCVFIWW